MSGIKGRSGRPKGSVNKVKDTSENPNNNSNLVQEFVETPDASDGYVVRRVPVKITKKYRFQYLGPGIIWYKVNGVDKNAKTNEIFEVDEETNNRFLGSMDYYEGMLVAVDNNFYDKNSPNQLNDIQIEKIFSKTLDNVKEHIRNLTSIFAVQRIKTYAVLHDKPASVVKTCETRVAELEEEEINNFKSPVYTEKGVIT